jgi:hypothetical protein
MSTFKSVVTRVLILSLLWASSSKTATDAFSISSSKSEIAAVEQQLGYVPPNFVKVTSWTSGGDPVAIQTYPLDGGAPRRQRKVSSAVGTPFPTLFWLCNAKIGRAIGDLERTGHVSILQERLSNDPEKAKLFRQAHDDYAEERWLSLTPEHRESLEQYHDGMRVMLQESGVSGTDYREVRVPNIKCLHAHYAHYRSSANGNIVGQWVHELLVKEGTDLHL